jgi:hypothetical protein
MFLIGGSYGASDKEGEMMTMMKIRMIKCE